jgi:predicted 3-demethylubiquinone-9 3-methyltransferase (glyoxalase superfamily)
MPAIQRIHPCLWFDDQGEEAATFYTGIFPNSRIVRTARYPDVGQEVHGGKAGSVLTVEFELDGQMFTALNGGPAFTFNEAISLQVMCENQAEVDRYWTKLSAGGEPKAQQCGWLRDRYGVSWQIVPAMLPVLMTDPDSAKTGRVMAALLEMKKLDIAALERAAAGLAPD